VLNFFAVGLSSRQGREMFSKPVPSNKQRGPLTTSHSAPDQVAAAFVALVGVGVERRQLDRDGRALRWLEAGAGEPTIVFEAGAMSPVASFAAVFKALARDHRVIAYDRAGYGASDPVPFDLERQLDDLVAVLEESGPGPRILVGHSWGGLLAQLVGWARPDLVSGLVLLDPSHESFWTELGPETLAEIGRHPSREAAAHEDSRSADVLKWGHELAGDVGRSVEADSEVEKLVVDACLSYLATDEQLFRYLDEVPMIVDHLHELAQRRAKAVWPQIPVVLLTATKGRPEELIAQVITTQEEVVAAASGKHIIVPDAGHYIHVDRPDLVLECIRDLASAGH
jgi:pimeloyl-ACP methyl ester carboxylesterase